MLEQINDGGWTDDIRYTAPERWKSGDGIEPWGDERRIDVTHDSRWMTDRYERPRGGRVTASNTRPTLRERLRLQPQP